METLAKYFKHIARDLFIYFIPGVYIMINATFLDHVFFQSRMYHHLLKIPYSYLLIIVVSYVIGQFICAFMYMTIERTGIESWVKKKFFLVDGKAWKIDYKKEMESFKKYPEVHEQFIERHTQLYMLRWNLSGTSVLCFIINIIFCCLFSFSKYIVLMSIGYLISAFFLYILSIETEKDCYDRINDFPI